VRRRFPPASYGPLARLLWQKVLLSRAAEAMRPALVCFDGLDEASVEQRELVAKYLPGFGAATGARVIVTSRIAGFGGNPLFAVGSAGHRELRLCAFDRADGERFINSFFTGDKDPIATRLIGELRSKPTVSAFASNPLLATLLCGAYEHGDPPLTLPVRRVDLYKTVLRGLLGEWPDERDGTTKDAKAPRRWQKLWPGISLKTMIDSKLLLLEAIADKFFPGQMFTNELLDQFLFGDPLEPTEAGFFDALKRSHPLSRRAVRDPPIIDELVEDGVLVRMGDAANPCYVVIHLTVQEFLVASALKRRGWGNIDSLIDRKSWDPRWEEVVIMLAGLLDDAGPLIEMLADDAKDDFIRHRTIIAGLMLPEMTEAARSTSEQQITRLTTTLLDKFGATKEGSRELQTHFGRAMSALALVNGRYRRIPLLLWLAKTAAKEPASWSEWCLEWFAESAATPALIGALTRKLSDGLSPSSELANAAHAFRWLGAAAVTPRVTAALLRLLADDEELVRASAARTFGSLGAVAATRKTVDSLRCLVHDDKWEARSAAADALVELGAEVVRPNVRALNRIRWNHDWQRGFTLRDVTRSIVFALDLLLVDNDGDWHPGWEVTRIVSRSLRELDRDA